MRNMIDESVSNTAETLTSSGAFSSSYDVNNGVDSSSSGATYISGVDGVADSSGRGASSHAVDSSRSDPSSANGSDDSLGSDRSNGDQSNRSDDSSSSVKYVTRRSTSRPNSPSGGSLPIYRYLFSHRR